jgi:hypothetical protein
MRGGGRTFALLAMTAMGCGFDTSGGSGSPGAPDDPGDPGGPGSPDASGTIGGDPGDPDAAVPLAQAVTPFGASTTVGDIGGNGGSPFTADCGDGRVITGLDAEDNDFGLCHLRAVCSRVTVDGDAIDVVDPAATQAFGNEGSFYDIDPVNCPDGSALVGFSGSESGNLVQHLRLRCAPIQVSGGAVSLGGVAEVPANLGSPSSDGSGTGSCPAGQLAAGIAGRAGSILDRFELRCYQVSLAPL